MRVHRSTHRSAGRATGGLLMGAVLAVGVAASLGAGYTVAKSSLSDGSAYVAKGTTVAHVNGESRTVDSSAPTPLAKNGERLQVVGLQNGRPVAVNQSTNTLTILDPSTQTPTTTKKIKGGGAYPVQVVASGDRGWLVDHDGRSVTPIVNGKLGKPVSVPSAPVDAAPGPDSSVILLDAAGHVIRVDTDRTRHRVAAPAAPKGALTRANGHTYLVSADSVVTQVDTDSPASVASVPGVVAGANGTVAGSVQGVGSHVLIVSGEVLTIVDVGTGAHRSVSLHSGTDALGRPVEYRGKAYVPDYDAHVVYQVDESKPAVLAKIAVPGTSHRPYALFVAGGKLWANDQYAEHLLVVDSGGHHQADKGPGNGVRNDPVNGPAKTTPGSSTPGGTSTTTPTGSGGTGSGNAGSGGSSSGGTGGAGSGGTSGGGTPSRARVTIPATQPHEGYQDYCARLTALQLNCTPVAAGADAGDQPDDVTRTNPGAGAKVPVGSTVTVSYVGPAHVPDVVGRTPYDACTAVTAANLLCRSTSGQTPVTELSEFGTVASTDPAAGAELAKGKPVTVTYNSSFVLPDLTGKTADDACRPIKALRLVLQNGSTVTPDCTSVTGDPVAKGSGKRAGDVYSSSPAAGATVDGSKPVTVTVTVYDGTSSLPDYNGMDGATAQSDCGGKFANCTLSTSGLPIDGDGNGRVVHPDRAHHVYQVTVDGQPADPSKRYSVNSTVALTQYRDTPDQVPDVRNQSVTDACNHLLDAGYSCDTSNHPLDPRTGIALDQNVAPGTSGTLAQSVQIPNADQPVVLFDNCASTTKTAKTDDTMVTRVGTSGQCPAGTSDTGPAFKAYANNADVPGGKALYNWSCNCLDHNPNFVASVGTPGGAGSWAKPDNAAAILIPPSAPQTCASGQVQIWRVSDYHMGSAGPTNHTYHVAVNAGPPDSDYDEFLGCGWP